MKVRFEPGHRGSDGVVCTDIWGKTTEAETTTSAMTLRQDHAWLFNTQQEETCDCNGTRPKKKKKKEARSRGKKEATTHVVSL